MATFFGEVIFSSSRVCTDAYDDDDEYEEGEENSELQAERYEIEMISTSDKKLSCGALIVSFGLLANEFLQGCLRTDETHLVGKIEMRKLNEKDRIDTGDFRSKVYKSSPVFLSKKGALLCQASEDLTPDLAWKFAKKILSLGDESCPILVLSSQHSSKLKSDMDGFQRCSSYCLSTPNIVSKASVFPPLPQPSVLESIPAAIMTESLIGDRHCMICTSYVESFSAGDVDLVAGDFIKVISEAPFKVPIQYKGPSKVAHIGGSDLLDRYM